LSAVPLSNANASTKTVHAAMATSPQGVPLIAAAST
jgi:hypothetical protein